MPNEACWRKGLTKDLGRRAGEKTEGPGDHCHRLVQTGAGDTKFGNPRKTPLHCVCVQTSAGRPLPVFSSFKLLGELGRSCMHIARLHVAKDLGSPLLANLGFLQPECPGLPSFLHTRGRPAPELGSWEQTLWLGRSSPQAGAAEAATHELPAALGGRAWQFAFYAPLPSRLSVLALRVSQLTHCTPSSTTTSSELLAPLQKPPRHPAPARK